MASGSHFSRSLGVLVFTNVHGFVTWRTANEIEATSKTHEITYIHSITFLRTWCPSLMVKTEVPSPIWNLYGSSFK